MLHPLQLDVFYALWGGSHHRVDYRRRRRLVLAEMKREAKAKEFFQPLDVVCLDENWGDIETQHQQH